MKLNKIALALVAVAAVPMVANAGVTVSPLLLGYHYVPEDTADSQRENLRVGKDVYATADNSARLSTAVKDKLGYNSKGEPIDGGIGQTSGLYTGAALGIELTPSTQFQIEYGVSNTEGEAAGVSSDDNLSVNRFDVEQETISGNFLIGFDQFTGYSDSAFRPYVLVGAGQSKLTVENQEAYSTKSPIYRDVNGKQTQMSYVPTDVTPEQLYKDGYEIKAGTQVASAKDKIGNLGLGAMYRVNDALSLRGEARATYNFDQEWWEGMALAGLEVVLGGHLAPTVVVPPEEPVEVVEEVVEVVPVPVEPTVIVQDVDSDGDGVVDRLDACPNTPANKVVDERGCPVQVPITEELKMELRVFFDNDKSIIKDQYKPEVAKVAEKMREYPNATARIEGHASKTGPSAKYNQRLSEARAIAVKDMLTKQYGVAPNRLSTIGYGYTRPIAPNNTREGRAMNRRVYAVITGNKTVTVDQTKDMVQ